MLVVIKHTGGLILLTQQWHHIDDTALVSVSWVYTSIVCFYFLYLKLQLSVLHHTCITLFISLYIFYAFDLFSLIVAKILWLIQELVYQPNSHSITNTIENRQAGTRRRALAHSSPYTRLSVLHRAPISALSVGKHWIDVRGQLGSVTDECHQELSLIMAIIMRKMTLQRSGRAVWTQQIRSRDLGQLGGYSRSCDHRDRRQNVTPQNTWNEN